MISVEPLGEGDPLTFQVRIEDNTGQTQHEVSLARADFDRLCAGDCAAETCVEAAIRFLLDREPKEAILARFDVSVIPGYFPEFERALPDYIAKAQTPGSGQNDGRG